MPKRKLTKKEKEILTNYETLRGIKEDTILNGGKVILKKLLKLFKISFSLVVSFCIAYSFFI